MAIDVETPGSPGWWMLALARQLNAEQPRMKRLAAYRNGRPPLVMGTKRLASAFYQFQQMSRSNFAELIVSAMTERMTVRSIRTAAATDDNGDQLAWRMWTTNNLDVGSTDVHDDMGTFGWTYVGVAGPAVGEDESVITIEDPRQVTTAQDPIRPDRTIAAFKLFHDDVRHVDYAILWIVGKEGGEKWVARRSRKARGVPMDALNPLAVRPLTPVAFNPSSFDLMPIGQTGPDEQLVWDAEQPSDVLDVAILDEEGYDGPTSERYDVRKVPMIKFGNRRGVGEFEHHTDLLDRINHTILNKIVIATLQAYKQRAIETSAEAGDDGGLPDEDEDGNQINYDELFEADPGALWRLPVGAKIWESGQADMNGILSSARDDILHLAAVSRTPFPMFSPDSANQSANGASLYREGLTFKVEDRCKIAGRAWAQVIALGFLFKGDSDRGNVAEVIVDWAPADRYGILEMAQADAQSTLPFAQKCSRIYGMTPAETAIAVSQRNQDVFMAGLGQQQQPPQGPLQVPSERVDPQSEPPADPASDPAAA